MNIIIHSDCKSERAGDVSLSFGSKENIESAGIINNASEANILYYGNIIESGSGWIPMMQIKVTH